MTIYDIFRQMNYMGATLVTGCPKDKHGNYLSCSACTTKVRCNMESITIDMMFRGEM